METKEFKTEWCLLQNQFDSYEKHSLQIKLLSVMVLLAAEMSDLNTLFTGLLLMVLWLQDAIWKTFQSRIESRLLQLEKYISEGSEESPFQFNSEYHKVRLRGGALISEYLRQSIRPTVAFPYVVLIVILVGRGGL
jgi:hypothetical protein